MMNINGTINYNNIIHLERLPMFFIAMVSKCYKLKERVLAIIK